MPYKKQIDDVPVHMKFGYQAVIEKEAIRKRLLAEGFDGDSARLFMAVEAAYIQAHANDMSYAERQKLWREGQCKTPTDSVVALTLEELQYLVAQLGGVNEPIGRDCLDKFSAALNKLVAYDPSHGDPDGSQPAA